MTYRVQLKPSTDAAAVLKRLQAKTLKLANQHKPMGEGLSKLELLEGIGA